MTMYNPGDYRPTYSPGFGTGLQTTPGAPNGGETYWGGWGREKDVNGQPIANSSQADRDISRYQDLSRQQVPGAQINTVNSDASRQYQVAGLGDTASAMGLNRSAALGEAPSAAEAYGHNLIDSSINSQMAMGASARGGPEAVAAAQRAAAFQGAQTQAQGAQQLAGMRANEMANAREQYGATANAYGQQANALRGNDFQQAYGQAGFDNDALQRQQQNQQYYDKLGFDVNNAQLNAGVQTYGINQQTGLGQRQNDLRTQEDYWGRIKDVVGGVGGAIGSAVGSLSDIRAKQDVYPIGTAPKESVGAGRSSLGAGFGALAHGMTSFSDERTKLGVPMSGVYMPLRSDEDTKFHFGAVSPGDAPSGNPSPFEKLTPSAGMDVLGSLKANSDFDTRFARNPGASPTSYSDERTKYTYSDEKTKDPIEAANRAQEASLYTYKPAFAAESGQAPGEVNVGPMAQTMARDPISATVVKEGPDGLLVLDQAKLMKLHSAGIASLQRQLDELRGHRG